MITWATLIPKGIVPYMVESVTKAWKAHMFRLVSQMQREIVSAYSRVPSDVRIIQYPSGNAVFSVLLDETFLESDFDSVRFPELTDHKGVNLVLLPIWTLILRKRGARIINIHWLTGPWQLPSIDSRFKRLILWYFFIFWINTLRLIGFRIVYTLHDHEPHSKIFNNDKKSIEFLLRKSHGIVFLNDGSKNLFSNRIKKQLWTVISEGSIHHSSTRSREETRKYLRVPLENKLLVLVGSLEEYKGIDLMFTNLRNLPTDVSIRIAGTSPIGYQRELEKLKVISDRKKLDIDIKFGFLSDDEFGEYLEAADYFLYPCRLINNSGSLNAALSHGLPVIVPKICELSWVPETCKIYINGQVPEMYDIQGAIESLDQIDMKSYDELSSNAVSFSNRRSWPLVGESYIQFYEEIMGLPKSRI